MPTSTDVFLKPAYTEEATLSKELRDLNQSPDSRSDSSLKRIAALFLLTLRTDSWLKEQTQ